MREHSAKLRQEAADFWTSMVHRFEALRTAVQTEVQHSADLASFRLVICVMHREALASQVYVDEGYPSIYIYIYIITGI